MVSVTSSIPGVASVGPIASSGRNTGASNLGAAVDATTAQNSVGLDTGGFAGQQGTALSQPAAAAFAAQAFAQESGTAPLFPTVNLAQYAAAAYQAASARSEARQAPDIVAPGTPPRLASGRMLDLTA